VLTATVHGSRGPWVSSPMGHEKWPIVSSDWQIGGGRI